jgi:hypothetical protein
MAKTKNELDKESMFNKIMPSSLIKKNMADNENSNDNTSPESTYKAPILNSIINQQLSNTEKSNDKFETMQPAPPQPILNSSRKVQIIQKRRSPIMLNIMERLVINKLDMAFNKFNCCKCDRCRQDVAALALNKLKPKYVILDESEIDDFIAKQEDASVTTAVIQAMLVVMAHPRH